MEAYINPLRPALFTPVNSWIGRWSWKAGTGDYRHHKVFVSRSKACFLFLAAKASMVWKYPILSWLYHFFNVFFFYGRSGFERHSFWISMTAPRSLPTSLDQQVLGIVVDLGALCLKFILGPQFRFLASSNLTLGILIPPLRAFKQFILSSTPLSSKKTQRLLMILCVVALVIICPGIFYGKHISQNNQFFFRNIGTS